MVNFYIKMEAVKSKKKIYKRRLEVVNGKTKTVNSNIKLKMVKGKNKRRLEIVNSKTKMANIELKVVKGKRNNIKACLITTKPKPDFETVSFVSQNWNQIRETVNPA